MAKRVSSNENVRKWRERKAAKGYKSLYIVIDPETYSKLMQLKKYYSSEYWGKCYMGELVTEAIKHLHKAIFNK